MATTYKLTDSKCVIRADDEAVIPEDTKNYDYIMYLKWVEAGNTPTPAEAKEDSRKSRLKDKLADLYLKCVPPLVDGDTVALDTLKVKIADTKQKIADLG
jgi:hypothetical protein